MTTSKETKLGKGGREGGGEYLVPPFEGNTGIMGGGGGGGRVTPSPNDRLFPSHNYSLYKGLVSKLLL